jgi:hypothetical protein
VPRTCAVARLTFVLALIGPVAAVGAGVGPAAAQATGDDLSRTAAAGPEPVPAPLPPLPETTMARPRRTSTSARPSPSTTIAAPVTAAPVTGAPATTTSGARLAAGVPGAAGRDAPRSAGPNGVPPGGPEEAAPPAPDRGIPAAGTVAALVAIGALLGALGRVLAFRRRAARDPIGVDGRPVADPPTMTPGSWDDILDLRLDLVALSDAVDPAGSRPPGPDGRDGAGRRSSTEWSITTADVLPAGGRPAGDRRSPADAGRQRTRAAGPADPPGPGAPAEPSGSPAEPSGSPAPVVRPPPTPVVRPPPTPVVSPSPSPSSPSPTPVVSSPSPDPVVGALFPSTGDESAAVAAPVGAGADGLFGDAVSAVRRTGADEPDRSSAATRFALAAGALRWSGGEPADARPPVTAPVGLFAGAGGDTDGAYTKRGGGNGTGAKGRGKGANGNGRRGHRRAAGRPADSRPAGPD